MAGSPRGVNPQDPNPFLPCCFSTGAAPYIKAAARSTPMPPCLTITLLCVHTTLKPPTYVLPFQSVSFFTLASLPYIEVTAMSIPCLLTPLPPYSASVHLTTTYLRSACPVLSFFHSCFSAWVVPYIEVPVRSIPCLLPSLYHHHHSSWQLYHLTATYLFSISPLPPSLLTNGWIE